MNTLLVLIHLFLLKPHVPVPTPMDLVARATANMRVPSELAALAPTFQAPPREDPTVVLIQDLERRRGNHVCRYRSAARNGGAIISDGDLQAMLSGAKDVADHPDDPFDLTGQRQARRDAQLLREASSPPF